MNKVAEYCAPSRKQVELRSFRVKTSGYLSFLRRVKSIANYIIVAMVVVKANEAARVVSEESSHSSRLRLLAQALIAVQVLVIAMEVEFYLFATHLFPL